MPEVDQHVAPMEEELYSAHESRIIDPDDLPSEFNEKLSYHRPTSYTEPWVFCSPTDHSSCLPPPDSVGIKDKIKSMLLKLSFKDFQPCILVQFWAAITTGGRCYLRTSEQPFALFVGRLGINSSLFFYRNNSVHCEFVVDGVSEEEAGFPVRVFRQQVLESSPDVRCYSIKQHPWCDRGVGLGLVALPVFDPSGKCCAGVLELVSAFFPSYEDEVNAACTALEAVDLKCLAQPCNHFDKKIRNKALQLALDEIKVVLKVVCETHKLPLAQTWVPCKQCNSEAISSFRNKRPRGTLSNISDARYLTNHDFLEMVDFFTFWQVQLQEDQGVVGRAYSCRTSSFCRDITQFSLIQYPMVHWAHTCLLFGCFAICLKSSHTGEDDYILEFFFPQNERIYTHPPRPQILDKILETMKQHFSSSSFKVASWEPLEVVNNGRDIGSTELSDAASNFLSNGEPACSNMPRGQAMATAAHMMPQVTTMQDVKTVDIKADYEGTLIRFKLPPTAGMVNLEEEIVKRLKFLQVGCFKVTYLDEDNDSILLACDTDLQNLLASGITKIRMFIKPETNRQP